MDVLDTLAESIFAGFLDLTFAEINSEDFPVSSNLVAGDDGIESKSASEIENNVSGLDIGETVWASDSLVVDVILSEDVQLLLGVPSSEENFPLITDCDSLILDFLGNLVVDGLDLSLDFVIDLLLVLLIEIDEISWELLSEFFKELEFFLWVNLLLVGLLLSGGNYGGGDIKVKLFKRGENSFWDSESVLAMSLPHNDEVGIILRGSFLDLFDNLGSHSLVLQYLSTEDLSESISWNLIQGQISSGNKTLELVIMVLRSSLVIIQINISLFGG